MYPWLKMKEQTNKYSRLRLLPAAGANFRSLAGVLALFQALLFIAMPLHMVSGHHSLLPEDAANYHILRTTGRALNLNSLSENIVTTEDNHCLLSLAAHFGGTASLQAAASRQQSFLPTGAVASYALGPFKSCGVLAIAPKHSPPSA